MPASYPGAIKTFTTKTNKVDLVDAAHVNDLQNEVTAIETELGTNVRGSSTDLVARLARALANNGAIANGTAFPTSPTPVDGQMFYRTDEDALYVYNGTAWQSIVPVASAGNVLTAKADTERASAGASYVKVKEISIPVSGTLRIKFDLKSSGGGNTYGRIYRNGVAVGTEQIDFDAVYTTYSEDISGWTAGDLCQLYIKEVGAAGAVKNFRIYEATGRDYLVMTD